MYIGKSERTPEYFGMICALNKGTLAKNPYLKDNPDCIKWINSFNHRSA